LQLKYLTGYPDDLQRQVHKLIADNQLANVLLTRYGATHDIRTDKALYQYVTALKNDFIRNGVPISKVVFDGKIHIIRHALGTHTAISRVQGNKLKAKREISVSSLFKHVPIEFLKMIVVHELAHLKEKEHDKTFYKLCTYMEPQYHQYELDLRLYLTHLDLSGKALWAGPIERSPLI
jgi:UTP pyrophosphatase